MEKTIFNCPHCGRIIQKIDLKPDRPKPACPECGSRRNFKNGFRRTTEASHT